MHTVWVERTQSVEVPGLGQKIKEVRERSDRPMRELANAAGMTPANWYRIENEEVKKLPETTLKNIEEVLGVDFGVKFN